MSEPRKYRKKPVVVEAMRWKHDGLGAIIKWTESRFTYDDTVFYIDTLEGTMEAQPGDYIIKGVKGEFYPCKPEVFELTYELLTQENPDEM